MIMMYTMECAMEVRISTLVLCLDGILHGNITARVGRGLRSAFFVLLSMTFLDCCQTSVDVDLNKPNHRFQKFWTHVGFSPLSSSVDATESLLLSKDEQVNLALISALPNGGVTHVRIHWLLNLIGKRDGEYDWSKLDKLLDWIVDLKLNLMFELMGVPDGERGMVVDWESLCSQLADHLLGRYGREALQQWMFELWNEPDLKQYNTANFTLESYLNYAKWCINGIRGRIPSAVIGGPAGLFKNITHHKLCWGLLDECDSLRNRCRINYISFHKKNFPRELIADTINMVNSMRSKYKGLSSLPFYNSESDVVSGWWKPLEFRGDVGYPVAIAEIIDLFISNGLTNYFMGISNDNGFMNTHPYYFSQRTLLTRFNCTSPNATQFIKKPVYVATGMLGMLEKFLVHRINNNSSISAIATLDQSSNATLSTIVILNPRVHSTGSSPNVPDVRVILPRSWGSVHYTLHVLSNALDHPRKVWRRHGEPDCPGPHLRRLMRKAEGPHLAYEGVSSGSVRFEWTFPSPSLGLLRICTEFIDKPKKIVGLKSMNISFNEVLLIWKDSDARCVKSYEVEFCSQLSNEADCFRRIDTGNVILNSFQYANNSGVPCHDDELVLGRYRVRAVNVWGVPGPYSAELHYPSFG